MIQAAELLNNIWWYSSDNVERHENFIKYVSIPIITDVDYLSDKYYNYNKLIEEHGADFVYRLLIKLKQSADTNTKSNRALLNNIDTCFYKVKAEFENDYRENLNECQISNLLADYFGHNSTKVIEKLTSTIPALPEDLYKYLSAIAADLNKGADPKSTNNLFKFKSQLNQLSKSVSILENLSHVSETQNNVSSHSASDRIIEDIEHKFAQSYDSYQAQDAYHNALIEEISFNFKQLIENDLWHYHEQFYVELRNRLGVAYSIIRTYPIESIFQNRSLENLSSLIFKFRKRFTYHLEYMPISIDEPYHVYSDLYQDYKNNIDHIDYNSKIAEFMREIMYITDYIKSIVKFEQKMQ
jgi:hypothetical protein